MPVEVLHSGTSVGTAGVSGLFSAATSILSSFSSTVVRRPLSGLDFLSSSAFVLAACAAFFDVVAVPFWRGRPRLGDTDHLGVFGGVSWVACKLRGLIGATGTACPVCFSRGTGPQKQFNALTCRASATSRLRRGSPAAAKHPSCRGQRAEKQTGLSGPDLGLTSSNQPVERADTSTFICWMRRQSPHPMHRAGPCQPTARSPNPTSQIWDSQGLRQAPSTSHATQKCQEQGSR